METCGSRNTGRVRIGRITPDGVIKEFPLPLAGSGPYGITPGPDGSIWFTENGGGRIGRISTGGQVTEFPLASLGTFPSGIAAGPDGNLWFGGNGFIGRVTLDGSITTFGLPGSTCVPHACPIPIPVEGIAAGADGNLWFTRSSFWIGRMTTDGAFTQFILPSQATTPKGIAAGPDGNLWFTEGFGSFVGRSTPAGAITEFLYGRPDHEWLGIAAGPDDNMWVADHERNAVTRITLPLYSELTVFRPTSGEWLIRRAKDRESGADCLGCSRDTRSGRYARSRRLRRRPPCGCRGLPHIHRRVDDPPVVGRRDGERDLGRRRRIGTRRRPGAGRLRRRRQSGYRNLPRVDG